MKFIFALIFVLSQSAIAAVPKELKNYSSRAESLMKRYKINSDDLGVRITIGEGEDLTALWEVRPREKMIPASTSKVLTASAVLDAFPPGTKVTTQLLISGKEKNGVLEGSLYLKGGGDPGFVSENMWYLVNAFTRSGIKEIRGDLVVDDSLFDKKRFDDSRQEQRVDRAYDAPVGAMSFNWNSMNIFVRPGEPGAKAQVFVDPENEYVRLDNRTKTVSGSANKLIADRDPIKGAPGDRLIMAGSLGAKSKEITVFKNITEPDLWAGYNLKSFLMQRGIELKGKIRNGVTPDSANLVAESESKPIEWMVSDMNKFSNNYVAEMLTKLLATKTLQPATLSEGITKIRQHLLEIGVDAKEMEFYNPSGLTRDNKLSANAVWVVLNHLRNDFRVQPEFLTSLPIAGVDGTMKKRLKDTPGERWVRAKTGFLTNVVSLAGYAGRADGHVVTFSLIYNGKVDEGNVRKFFDDLLLEAIK